MRVLVGILAVTLVVGCSRNGRPEGSGGESSPLLRLAVVTDLQGTLEPCGCTSRPLGGIDRLAAQIRALRASGGPLVLLIAGDAFFDAGEIDPARVDQARRNARTLVDILNTLEVTAVLPGSRDRAQPAEALDALRQASEFPWLAMGSDTETLSTAVGTARLAVLGVRPGTAQDRIRAAVDAAQDAADLSIVLMEGSRRDANQIGSVAGVDFVVQAGLDQEAALAPRSAGDGWILHAGRQGQGLTVVDIHPRRRDAPFEDRSEWSRHARQEQLDQRITELTHKIEQWEAATGIDERDIAVQRERLAALQKQRDALADPASPSSVNAFTARWVALPESSPRDREVAELVAEHHARVNEANRVAFASLKPPPVGPEDVPYVGAEVCSTCHAPAFAWWRNHPHGLAYATLVEDDKQYNLDCVGCHVTGYGRPGGSTVTHNLGGKLVGVGCESCHGPGAAHAKNPARRLVRRTPEATCVACHNEEHSDLFDYDAYLDTIVVPGHGLPPQPP